MVRGWACFGGLLGLVLVLVVLGGFGAEFFRGEEEDVDFLGDLLISDAVN